MNTSDNLPSLYDDKVDIQANSQIPDINKVTAQDMNIIKALLENSGYISNDGLKDINNNQVNPKIPRYEGSYAVAYLSKAQPISAGDTNVLYDKSEIEGSSFKIVNSNVEVLEDCLALLSGSAFVDGSAGEGYVWGHIYVNDGEKQTEVTNNLVRIINRDYTQTSIPATPIKLKKGTTISMTVGYASSEGIVSLRPGRSNTFLSVVKI